MIHTPIAFTINTSYKGYSIKNFLRNMGLSSHYIVSLKYKEQIYLNDEVRPLWTPLSTGDKVSFLPYIKKESTVIPTEMPLQILFENEDYIALNKPTGMPTHPNKVHLKETLSNGLTRYFSTQGMDINPHPITRLDRGTSGIVLFAKHPLAQHWLTTHSLKKEYEAITEGLFPHQKGLIHLPILRPNRPTIKREIIPWGKDALTEYELLKTAKNTSHLRLFLHTGRTHQIRVHLSALGYPIKGDHLYGREDIPFLALHCSKLIFENLRDGKNITIHCSPDLSFYSLLQE